MFGIFLTLLFLLFSSQAWATNYCTSSQSCWLLSEGSGTTTADGSGNGNTGTFLSSGHPAWTATVPTFATSGTANNSLSYASGDYVSAGSNSSLANLSAMTLVTWVYLTGTPSYSARILNKQSTYGWLLDMTSSGATTLSFAVTEATSLGVTTSTSLSTGAWHSIILTWDGSVTATNVHIYIDNTEASYSTQTNAIAPRGNDSSEVMMIGNRPDGTRAFPGYISESAILNYVVNSTQRTEIYNYGLVHNTSGNNHGYAGFI